jgi:cation:H+ antiporter
LGQFGDYALLGEVTEGKDMSELLLSVLKVAGGLVFLVVGGEVLVRGATGLAAVLKISPLVVGLTVVAFGTSAPELAVSLQSAIAGSPDVAIGNLVGSNIFNVLFILGLSAIIVPLVVSPSLIHRDVPMMIFSSGLLYVFGRDGTISRFDGSILFGLLVAYVVVLVRQSRRSSLAAELELAKVEGDAASVAREGAGHLLFCAMLLVGGIIALTFGSRLLVDGSTTIARMWGVSELVIGLTIVAIGTSLPEVATSVLAALRGQRDIAVGNAVGSNIFNLLSVLGLSSMIAPQGIAVSGSALAFDIPVMIAVAVLCLPIFLTGAVIARWEGCLLLFHYLAYTTYLILDAIQAERSTLDKVMLYAALPITVVVIVASLLHQFKKAPPA